MEVVVAPQLLLLISGSFPFATLSLAPQFSFRFSGTREEEKSWLMRPALFIVRRSWMTYRLN